MNKLQQNTLNNERIAQAILNGVTLKVYIGPLNVTEEITPSLLLRKEESEIVSYAPSPKGYVAVNRYSVSEFTNYIVNCDFSLTEITTENWMDIFLGSRSSSQKKNYYCINKH